MRHDLHTVCGNRHGEFFCETGVKGDLIRSKMLQFPKATLVDALQRYSIQNPESTAPKTKKPDSSIAKARQLFERVTGVQDTDNFLTLTWLTMDELKKPQMSQRLKYLFDDSKGASTKDLVAPNTLRTTLEEARAIVYAAARHVDANGDYQNPAHVAEAALGQGVPGVRRRGAPAARGAARPAVGGQGTRGGAARGDSDVSLGRRCGGRCTRGAWVSVCGQDCASFAIFFISSTQ